MIELKKPVVLHKSSFGDVVGVADSTGRLLCIVPLSPDAVLVAETLVRTINSPRWWHRFRINKPYTKDDWLYGRKWWVNP